MNFSYMQQHKWILQHFTEWKRSDIKSDIWYYLQKVQKQAELTSIKCHNSGYFNAENRGSEWEQAQGYIGWKQCSIS